MGAAIALQLAADAEFDGVVDRLVLDSPVLDWQATINANCGRAGLPSWIGAFARPWLQNRWLARFVGLPSEILLARFDWHRRADRLSPTLILHGVGDTSAPVAVSQLLRDLRPNVVQLEMFRSDHTMSWNADPGRWRSIAGGWLS